MIVYRIAHKNWAGILTASGMPARWNTKGKFMLYTGASRALACLENLVYRRSIGPDELFRITLIEIPEHLSTDIVTPEHLPPDWKEYAQYGACQAIGDAWLQKGETALLKVPSSIIPEEHNYLLNVYHQDMKFIKVLKVEPFSFDFRLTGPE